MGASALGIAQAAYEWTLEYLWGRSDDGRPLLQEQRVQQVLADVATEIEAARLLVWRAAWMGRNGVPMTGGQGSMSKLKGGDVAMWATTTLMDLVGPEAQSTDCPLEKWFRDAKIYQLFEGTAQIQRLVIARMQAAEYAERLQFAKEVATHAQANGAMNGAVVGRRPATRRRRGVGEAVLVGAPNRGVRSRHNSRSRRHRARRAAGRPPSTARHRGSVARDQPPCGRPARRLRLPPLPGRGGGSFDFWHKRRIGTITASSSPSWGRRRAHGADDDISCHRGDPSHRPLDPPSTGSRQGRWWRSAATRTRHVPPLLLCHPAFWRLGADWHDVRPASIGGRPAAPSRGAVEAAARAPTTCIDPVRRLGIRPPMPLAHHEVGFRRDPGACRHAVGGGGRRQATRRV